MYKRQPYKRARTVLVPAQQNTVDDAMEAILEEMESHIEEVESVNEEPVIHQETPVVEEVEIRVTEEVQEASTDLEPKVEPVISIDHEPEEVSTEVVEPEEDLEEIAPENVLEDAVVEEEVAIEIEAPGAEVEAITQSNDEALDISVFEDLLRSLGLEDDADLLHDNGDILAIRRKIASHVGIEPRDMRLDRLLRPVSYTHLTLPTIYSV